MNYDMCTWDWCIPEYFKSSTKFLNECRIVDVHDYISNDDTNMARIKLGKVDVFDTRCSIMSISIKSKQCVNLSRVRCYRIKKTSLIGSTERLKVANKKFYRLSNEWEKLNIRDNFVLYKDEDKLDRQNLTLQFEFIFKKNYEIESDIYLQTDIRAYLMNSAFSDITIRTSEADEVPAHKILLVARSDVFRAHFQHDTVEKSTNIVECPFETNVVKDLLTYIYQDVAPNIEETAFKLLEAADYYHLDRLKELCRYVLTKKLNVDNAVELLTLAETHNASSMKTDVLEFITDEKNCAKIVKTEGWKLISRELAKSIFEFISCNV